LPLTVLAPLQQQIRQTQQLIAQAQRMAVDVQQVQTQFEAQYRNVNLSGSQQSLVQGAESRWQNSVAAFEDALKIQAGAVSNIEGTRQSIEQLVTASQSATGALQAAQAGNQLLAVQSQQLADLTATMATLGRAQSLDAANSATAKAQAREQLRRFLAPGRGYVPTTAQMFRN
jgi:P-type conjugative transfer protein TrbJ